MHFLLTKVIQEGKGDPAGLESDKCFVVADDIYQAAKKIGRDIRLATDDGQPATLQLIGPEREFYEKWMLTFLPECTGPF